MVASLATYRANGAPKLQEVSTEERSQMLHLLLYGDASTPAGGTPDTLVTQEEPTDFVSNGGGSNVSGDDNLSQQVKEIMDFVDNFDFANAPSTWTFETPQINTKSNSNVGISESPSVVPSSEVQKDYFQSNRVALSDRPNEPGRDDTTTILKNQPQTQSRIQWSKNDHVIVDDDDEDQVSGIPLRERGMAANPNTPSLYCLVSRSKSQNGSVSDSDWEKFNQLVQNVEQALQEAMDERDATHAWTAKVRETTYNWMKEQRALIEKERASLGLMAVDDHTSNSPEQSQIERLKNDMHRLQLELKTNELHRQTTEQRLLSIIQLEKEKVQRPEQNCQADSASGVEKQQLTKGRAALLSGRVTPWHRPQPESYKSLQKETSLSLPNCISFSSQQNVTDTPYPGSDRQSCSSELRKKICFSENISSPKKTTNARFDSLFPLARNTPEAAALLAKTQSENRDNVVTFKNGVQKEVRVDGTTLIRFPNGDVEISHSATGKSVAYYHSKSKVVEITTTDDSTILEYPSGQVERHYKDGRKLIRFPDGSTKQIYPHKVETLLPCGKYLIVGHPDGTRNVT